MARGATQADIPKFTRENYDNWIIQMRAFRGAQDVMDIIEDGYGESPSKEVEATMSDAQRTILQADQKKFYKVKFIIYQGLDEAMFKIIASAKTSKETWGYILKRKSRVFDKFKEFKAVVEKQSSYRIKSL
ncbi:uncharacterized protein LOC131153678 [Malania oleifera]|uniref:uncharacterized protein LOC131153678 n=1 Tax=Malania oleifera TaxID=397392 RepID=UPI0025ADE68C|nr:uncharacterized protein LOC131153678 [Malania oleifera]